ncbi:MAG: hypothetical protein OEW06_11185 [Gemmatimonadota bacterium]|nr:hypothetical protein [Gemmatimonadota bacterium]MDH4350406.1 hypothetical protein [Gemmatimonadota bacterium]
MMLLLALVAALQGTPWVATPQGATVGDTIVLERIVPVAPGTHGRTRELDASEVVEPLGVPTVVSVATGLRVRHVIALFTPGVHAVSMPAIEVLHPDGTVEVVLGDTALVRVAAVIPDSMETPVPMPSQAPLARPVRRPGRAAAPVVGVLVLLAVWLAWWRRTAREVARPPEPAAVLELPLMRWLASGERRAVATVAVHRLRTAVADAVPDADRATTASEWQAIVAAAQPAWPVAELADILRALERARFAPIGADDLVELVDRADVALAALQSGESQA